MEISEQMKVYVSEEEGGTRDFYVSIDSTVGELEALLVNRGLVENNEFELSFRGEILRSQQRLNSYGIGNLNTVRLRRNSL